LALGQTFSRQVYFIAEDFSEDTCDVSAACDCCAGEIYFLSDNKFCLVSLCLSGDSYFTGTYSTKSNKLILTFDKEYVVEVMDDNYNIIKLEKMTTKNTDPLVYDILKCGQNLRLTHASASKWKNGARYYEQRENERMKELPSSAPWKLLSQ